MPDPAGAVRVVDPSPLNWLYITYNTAEELVRANPEGTVEPAAMAGYRWTDDRTLEVEVRDGEYFPDGEPLDARSVQQAFEEVMRWDAPHPPGTWLNFPAPESTAEVVDDYTLRFHPPGPDGLAIGKFRGFHIASSAFWNGKSAPGFGYKKFGSGDGHW